MGKVETKVDAAVKNFNSAKLATDKSFAAIKVLQKRKEELELSLRDLGAEVEKLQQAKKAAFAAFAINDTADTKAKLEASKKALAQAETTYAEQGDLIEAIDENLATREDETGKFVQAQSVANRLVWQAIFDEIQANLPAGVLEDIRSLLTAGFKRGYSYERVLDALIPRLHIDAFREIMKELQAKYKIDV